MTEGPLPEQALFRGCRCELLEAEGGWTELELGVWLFGGTGKRLGSSPSELPPESESESESWPGTSNSGPKEGDESCPLPGERAVEWVAGILTL